MSTVYCNSLLTVRFCDAEISLAKNMTDFFFFFYQSVSHVNKFFQRFVLLEKKKKIIINQIIYKEFQRCITHRLMTRSRTHGQSFTRLEKRKTKIFNLQHVQLR